MPDRDANALERGKMMKSAALRRLITIYNAALAIGLTFTLFPGTVHGAAAQYPYAAKTAALAGNLPLLLALTLGIALAVFSVIAFLQMTKGRNAAAAAGGQDTREALLRAAPSESPNKPADFKDGRGLNKSEEVLQDCTIPLQRVPKEPLLPDSGWLGKPRLYGLGGKFAGESFWIGEGGLSIGRDPAICHVVFPSDAGEISRRHCTIRFDLESGTFLLEDHGSSNGTYLSSGEKLIPGKSYPLKAGDRFTLSGAPHWFEIRE